MLSNGAHTIDGPHGVLHLQVWAADNDVPDRPVIAVHGVDGNHDTWAGLAAALDGQRSLVAVDLRGRGSSAHNGPFGVAAHATDLGLVLDKVLKGGADAVTLMGHSFGGHVVARLAADRPERIAEVVLVDGGAPRVVPEGMEPAALVAGALSNIVPNLNAKPYPVSSEAVEADFSSMVIDPDGARPLFEVSAPVILLRAELGVAEGLPPVVPESVVAELRASGVDIDDRFVPGATHFSVLSAAALAEALAG